LAEEEPSLTAIAVGPGLVDTDMQKFMRREAPKVMPPDHYRYYREIKRNGLLQHPDIPARSIAWLALSAPPQLNGKFLSFDDPRILKPAERFFDRRL
jgi:NAD(P)-dependent dehydrogenase (short-subunit alcohol dehydrogenase family)